MNLKIESDFYPDYETKLIASDETEGFGEACVAMEIWNDSRWNIIHLNVKELTQLRDFLSTIVGTKKG